MRAARMTPVRRQVLELILRADQPIKAYALLARLEEERGKLGPPTIYRALDFLLAHRLVHKVETSNAFVACSDVEHSHQRSCFSCTTITSTGVAPLLTSA